MMKIAIARVLIVLIMTGIFLYITYQRNREQYNTRLKLTCCILAIISAALTWNITNLFPLPTDQVKVTALHQQNENASSDEIYLTGVYANGQQVALKTATEDKWFWQGSWYVWRNGEDARRPVELSDCFVLEMPVGTARSIEFFTNKYKGMVRVDYGENSQIVDCFSEENGRVSAKITDTDLWPMRGYKILQLGVFAILFGAFCFILWCLYRFGVKEDGPLKKRICKHRNLLIYIGLGCFMLLCMRFYHQYNPMVWRDDWFGIATAWQDSLGNVIQYNLLQADTTPPLFNIIAFFWMRVIPHTLNAVFFLPQIFLFFSVIVMGICGEYLFGKTGGVMSAVITASSATLILSMGYEFRSYSMYFLFSALSLLLFSFNMEYCKHPVKIKILLTLSLIGLVYSHYFGIFTVGLLFLAEVALCAHKEKRIVTIFTKNFTRFLPYLISIGTFSIWMICTFVYRRKMVGQAIKDTWKSTPTLPDLINTFEYFVSNYTILKVIFCFSTIYLVVWLICRKTQAAEIKKELFISCVSLANIFIPAFVVFFLSQGVAMFAQRYFTASIPSVIIVILFGFHLLKNWLARYVGDSAEWGKRITAIFLLFFSAVLFYNMHTSLMTTLKNGDNTIIVDANIRPSENYIKIVDAVQNMTDINYRNTAVCVVRQSGAWMGSEEAYQFFGDTEKTRGINIINNSQPENYTNYDTLYVICYYNKTAANKAVSNDQELNEHFKLDTSYLNGAIHRYVRK